MSESLKLRRWEVLSRGISTNCFSIYICKHIPKLKMIHFYFLISCFCGPNFFQANNNYCMVRFFSLFTFTVEVLFLISSDRFSRFDIFFVVFSDSLFQFYSLYNVPFNNLSYLMVYLTHSVVGEPY